MSFDKIMEGFVQAQIKGDTQAGLDFLNGANAALESQLETKLLSSNVVAFSTGNGACQVREND